MNDMSLATSLAGFSFQESRRGSHPRALAHPQPFDTMKLDSNDRFQSTPKADVHVQDARLLASYNWTNDSKPTLLVPGLPPKWIEREMPMNLSSNKNERDSSVRTEVLGNEVSSFDAFFASLQVSKRNRFEIRSKCLSSLASRLWHRITAWMKWPSSPADTASEIFLLSPLKKSRLLAGKSMQSS